MAPITLETLLSMSRTLLKQRLRQSLVRLVARVLGARLGARLVRSRVVHALRHAGAVDFEHAGLVVRAEASSSPRLAV